MELHYSLTFNASITGMYKPLGMRKPHVEMPGGAN